MTITRGKTALLVVLLAGSGYYGFSKYQELTPSAAINNGVSSEFGSSRRGGGDDASRQNQFKELAGLTPEQEKAMRKLRKSGVEGRDRWTSMSAILTPEQRTRMQATMQERRDRGAKAALSPTDFAKYSQKRDQMRANRPPRQPRTRGNNK